MKHLTGITAILAVVIILTAQVPQAQAWEYPAAVAGFMVAGGLLHASGDDVENPNGAIGWHYDGHNAVEMKMATERYSAHTTMAASLAMRGRLSRMLAAVGGEIGPRFGPVDLRLGAEFGRGFSVPDDGNHSYRSVTVSVGGNTKSFDSDSGWPIPRIYVGMENGGEFWVSVSEPFGW